MADRSNARFWLVDQNPFGLPEPSPWWQKLVLDHDKMLRLMPSQTDRCYRLCRVIRREARLGMRLVADMHKHPDTVAMAQFGVVPELTLVPHAIHSTHIVGLLRSRDNWLNFRNAEDRANQIEKQEADAEAAMRQEHDAQLDEVNTDSFRHIKYGYREMLQPKLGMLKPLPMLPAVLPPSFTRFAFGLQNR